MLKKKKIETLSLTEENLDIKKSKKIKKDKKKKINIKKFLIILFASLVILLSITFLFILLNKNKKVELKQIETTEPEDVVEKYSASFIGVGML